MEANRKDDSESENRLDPTVAEHTELVGGIQVPVENESIGSKVSAAEERAIDEEGRDSEEAPLFPGEKRKPQAKGDRSKKEEEPLSQIGDLRQFAKDVYAEFKKISWPGARETLNATWSVIALVAVITLLVLGFDWLLAHAFFQPLEHWARLHGGGLGHTSP